MVCHLRGEVFILFYFFLCKNRKEEEYEKIVGHVKFFLDHHVEYKT